MLWCAVMNLPTNLSGHCNMHELPILSLKMSLSAHSLQHNSTKMLFFAFSIYFTLQIDLFLCHSSAIAPGHLSADTAFLLSTLHPILSKDPCRIAALAMLLCLVLDCLMILLIVITGESFLLNNRKEIHSNCMYNSCSYFNMGSL